MTKQASKDDSFSITLVLVDTWCSSLGAQSVTRSPDVIPFTQLSTMHPLPCTCSLTSTCVSIHTTKLLIWCSCPHVNVPRTIWLQSTICVYVCVCMYVCMDVLYGYCICSCFTMLKSSHRHIFNVSPVTAISCGTWSASHLPASSDFCRSNCKSCWMPMDKDKSWNLLVASTRQLWWRGWSPAMLRRHHEAVSFAGELASACHFNYSH